MTEELKKEAEESAKKFFGKPTDLVDLDNLRIFKNGYLDGAEPREKRIAELKKQLDLKEKALSKAKKETKRVADRVNKDKRRLIRRKAELEAQIEKMKCCENCAWWYKLPNGQRDCAETCENLDNWSLRR